jgi:hypothetical protein
MTELMGERREIATSIPGYHALGALLSWRVSLLSKLAVAAALSIRPFDSSSQGCGPGPPCRPLALQPRS